MDSAILLIAHGSRREQANNDLHRLAEMVREREPGRVVEVAFLEIAQPTIPEGAEACLRHGVSQVCLLPFFLSPGSHVTDDLERYRQEFASAHPHVDFVLCPPLGLHPSIVDILLGRLQEGVAGTA